MKKAYFQMHVAILLWGFTGILGKAISLPEGLIVWYRLIISALGLLPFMWSKGYRIRGSELLKISGVGVLIAFHWILFYGAIKASNVSITLSCFSSVSLFTAILDPLSRGQKPKLLEMLLALMVILGLYLIFTVRQVYVTGMLLAVASALVGSCFTILNKRYTEHHPAGAITFYELLAGFVVLSCCLPVYFQYTGTTFSWPGFQDWIYLLLLGLVCTSYALTLSLKALKLLDAFTLNLSVNLEPLYSIVLAVVLFGETEILSSGFVAGTCVILGSVVMHSWIRWRHRQLKLR